MSGRTECFYWLTVETKKPESTSLTPRFSGSTAAPCSYRILMHIGQRPNDRFPVLPGPSSKTQDGCIPYHNPNCDFHQNTVQLVLQLPTVRPLFSEKSSISITGNHLPTVSLRTPEGPLHKQDTRTAITSDEASNEHK